MHHKDARETDNEEGGGGGRDGTPPPATLSLMTAQNSEKLLNFKVTEW